METEDDDSRTQTANGLSVELMREALQVEAKLQVVNERIAALHQDEVDHPEGASHSLSSPDPGPTIGAIGKTNTPHSFTKERVTVGTRQNEFARTVHLETPAGERGPRPNWVDYPYQATPLSYPV